MALVRATTLWWANRVGGVDSVPLPAPLPGRERCVAHPERAGARARARGRAGPGHDTPGHPRPRGCVSHLSTLS
ncbi:hypothetical protein ACFQVA_27150 [Actinomadura keratinilytica]